MVRVARHPIATHTHTHKHEHTSDALPLPLHPCRAEPSGAERAAAARTHTARTLPPAHARTPLASPGRSAETLDASSTGRKGGLGRAGREGSFAYRSFLGRTGGGRLGNYFLGFGFAF